MFMRMVKLMIKQNRQIEDARITLGCHKTFSLDDSFKLFDITGNGKVTETEILQVFMDHNIEMGDVTRLV